MSLIHRVPGQCIGVGGIIIIGIHRETELHRNSIVQTITIFITLHVDSNGRFSRALNVKLSPSKTFAQAQTEFAMDLRL
jgi:hypothetical protein